MKLKTKSEIEKANAWIITPERLQLEKNLTILAIDNTMKILEAYSDLKISTEAFDKVIISVLNSQLRIREKQLERLLKGDEKSPNTSSFEQGGFNYLQNGQTIKGNQDQEGQKVEGNQEQGKQTIEGYQYQSWQTIKGNQWQNGQKVNGHQYQNSQTIEGNQWQYEQKVKGKIYIQYMKVSNKETTKLIKEFSNSEQKEYTLSTFVMWLREKK